MKNILFLFLFFLSGNLAAQDSLKLSRYNLNVLNVEYKRSIKISSDYFFGSNAITNSFVQKYYLNGFINDDLKKKVYDKLKSSNRFGGEINFGIEYKVQTDSIMHGAKHKYFYMKLRHTNLVDAKFSDDLFKVYFSGNSNYAGRTADFGNFNYESIAFQSFELGRLKSFDGRHFNYTIGGGIALVKGQNFRTIEADPATLFTETGGEFLDTKLRLTYHENDSANSNITAWNGTGFSVSIFYKMENEKNILQVELTDFGFVNWDDKSASIRADTSFHFDGVEVNNLFDFTDSVYVHSSLSDSSYFQSFLNHRSKENYLQVLPSKFSLIYSHKFKTTDRWKIGAGAIHRSLANYSAYTFVFADYQWKHLLATLKLNYGNYSGFNAGVAFDWKVEKGWLINIHSDYIAGYFLPDKTTAQGAGFSLKKSF